MRTRHVYFEWKNHVGGGAFQFVRIDSVSLVYNRNKAFSSSDISNSPFNSNQLQQKHSPSPMAYVERGVVKSKRSIWRLKTITDFFWAIVNIIGVFFATMFSMEKSDAYRKGSAGKKWDGGAPGGPGGGGSGGGGPYGGGPRGPPRGGLDNVRGIDSIRGRDHSSLPACGSCCG